MLKIILLIVVGNFSLLAQSSSFLFLSQKIDSMVVEDQKSRHLLSYIYLGKTDSTNKQHTKLMFIVTDSLNQIEVKKIFKIYGYPTITMVGQKSNHNFWVLAQHCDKDVRFQKAILGAMKKLIQKNECSKPDFAYLTDRVKINQGKAQIYGTQVQVNDSGTAYIPKKLRKPNEVDKRREKMDIYPSKLQDYLNNMTRDFIKK